MVAQTDGSWEGSQQSKSPKDFPHYPYTDLHCRGSCKEQVFVELPTGLKQKRRVHFPSLSKEAGVEEASRWKVCSELNKDQLESATNQTSVKRGSYRSHCKSWQPKIFVKTQPLEKLNNKYQKIVSDLIQGQTIHDFEWVFVSHSANFLTHQMFNLHYDILSPVLVCLSATI